MRGVVCGLEWGLRLRRAELKYTPLCYLDGFDYFLNVTAWNISCGTWRFIHVITTTASRPSSRIV